MQFIDLMAAGQLTCPRSTLIWRDSAAEAAARFWAWPEYRRPLLLHPAQSQTPQPPLTRAVAAYAAAVAVAAEAAE